MDTISKYLNAPNYALLLRVDVFFQSLLDSFLHQPSLLHFYAFTILKVVHKLLSIQIAFKRDVVTL